MTDTGRELSGEASVITAAVSDTQNGVLRIYNVGVGAFGGGSNGRYANIDMAASRVWGTHAGAEFAPAHIWQPACLYLGRPA